MIGAQQFMYSGFRLATVVPRFSDDILILYCVKALYLSGEEFGRGAKKIKIKMPHIT